MGAASLAPGPPAALSFTLLGVCVHGLRTSLHADTLLLYRQLAQLPTASSQEARLPHKERVWPAAAQSRQHGERWSKVAHTHTHRRVREGVSWLVTVSSRCFQDYIDPDDGRTDDNYVEPAETHWERGLLASLVNSGGPGGVSGLSDHTSNTEVGGRCTSARTLLCANGCSLCVACRSDCCLFQTGQQLPSSQCSAHTDGRVSVSSPLLLFCRWCTVPQTQSHSLPPVPCPR